VDDVAVKMEPAVRYVACSRQLCSEQIDAYVRDTIELLRGAHRATGAPFTLYHGCSKQDEQIVEVCLPTADGDRELPAQELAFTVARGRECEHPQILEAYDAVAAFAAATGRATHGAPRETYLTEILAPEPVMEVAFPLLPS
jgi:hypothetical protein